MKVKDQHFPNLLIKRSGFYWNAPPRARAAGFGSIPLGKQLDTEALERYAAAQCRLEEWRKEQNKDAPARTGTIDWLIADYMKHRWYTEKGKKTKDDYRNKLLALANFRLESGRRFGSLSWTIIEPRHTDKLYELMCFAEDGSLRQPY